MSYRIKCYTLFDITYTGITNNRNKENVTDWQYKRNTQCNLDTILQVISLRAQPENISNPIKSNKDKKFGSKYSNKGQQWTFVFDIAYHSVFNDGTNELGLLYNDCQGVPMIICGTEQQNLITSLDVTDEYRNIYFEIINE